MTWLDAIRARLHLLVGRRAMEARMNEEVRFHVEMETERLMRDAHLDAEEARRRALVAFGGVEKVKEELRDGRGLRWLSGLSLDLKLGLRMLVKYPGLTVVGVIGMSVAVAIAAITFGIIYTVIDPTLPLDGGDRIIALQNIDQRLAGEGRETHLHDLAIWREALPAVATLGAYRTVDRNLITPRGRPEAVRIAEMSAAGFRVARVPPLLGRYFNEDDEREGAAPVVVIGYTVWQNRFLGATDVVGSEVQLGATLHTIIGVMPQGFAFPVNNRVWTPLRLDPSDYEYGNAPPIEVFGRLASGATLREAQTQMTAIGQRLATMYPQTHEHVRPRVLPYPRTFIDAPDLIWGFHIVQLLISMLLVVIGTNVAVLVYARTATRLGEIAVRSALGASRARIVAQLFAEALVLSAAASIVGLVTAEVALGQVNTLLARMGGEQVPFWLDFDGVSPGLVLYVAGLAILAAVIVGVLPALKATRRDVHINLQHIGAGGSGMRLGKTWTLLIVTQVAVAVACLPVALAGLGSWVRSGMVQPGFATSEFLTASLRLDREGSATESQPGFEGEFAARYTTLQAELLRKLDAEPRVADVVLVSALPGNEPNVRIEAERDAATSSDTIAGRGAAGHAVGVMRVESDFFDAFDIPMLVGRGFEPRDASDGAAAVIVNRSFVQQVLGGGNALGRRVRRVANVDRGSTVAITMEPWYEIVGVVPDYPNLVDPGVLEPKLYQPFGETFIQPGRQRSVEGRLQRELPGQPAAIAGEAGPSVLAVRVRGAEPATFADRLREIAISVDPMLRVSGVAPLEESLKENAQVTRIVAFAVMGLTASVILLSAAGIYALMAFTITRRRREIGIRSALGADARNVLWSVLSKAMSQIAIGIAIGLSVTGLLDWATGGEMLGGRSLLLLPAVAVFMTLVGVSAAVGPARIALSIQPTEALRGDG